VRRFSFCSSSDVDVHFQISNLVFPVSARMASCMAGSQMAFPYFSCPVDPLRPIPVSEWLRFYLECQQLILWEAKARVKNPLGLIRPPRASTPDFLFSPGRALRDKGRPFSSFFGCPVLPGDFEGCASSDLYSRDILPATSSRTRPPPPPLPPEGRKTLVANGTTFYYLLYHSNAHTPLKIRTFPPFLSGARNPPIPQDPPLLPSRWFFFQRSSRRLISLSSYYCESLDHFS